MDNSQLVWLSTAMAAMFPWDPWQLIAPSECSIYTGGSPCPVCSAASSSSRQTAAKTGPNFLQLHILKNPIGSMYGIYANIWGILMVNVSIYTIHCHTWILWEFHHSFVTASTGLPTCWPSNRFAAFQPSDSWTTGCSLQTSYRQEVLEWSRKHPVGTHIPVGMHYLCLKLGHHKLVINIKQFPITMLVICLRSPCYYCRSTQGR